MSFKFDHRLLADEMEIYFLNDAIGAGLPVWLPNGVAIRDSIEEFIKKQESLGAYQRVVSPHIAKAELYEQSGHMRAFHENMFPPLIWPENQQRYYLKPMNCPHHHRIFASKLRSYRELPLRLAEYGQVYRFENSGSLRGLMRARSCCQNDAHIYVDPEDSYSEMISVLKLHEYCFSALEIKGYRYRLSKHDPKNLEYFDGPLELWIKAENILRQALIDLQLPYFEAEGEAAFYGPKIDVQMRIGSSEESIASVQLDFNAAEKFELKFASECGIEKRPWVIHRAPLGSHERFIAMLLEYFDGQLPAWLAPIQCYLIPMSRDQVEMANELALKLRKEDIRTQVDISSGSLSKRLVYAHKFRPFCIIVLGGKEIQGQELVLQLRDKKEKVDMRDLESYLKQQVKRPD